MRNLRAVIIALAIAAFSANVHAASLSHSPAFVYLSIPSGSGVPVVEITDVRPNIIWPPNHGMEVVTVSGVVSMSGGCTLSRASSQSPCLLRHGGEGRTRTEGITL